MNDEIIMKEILSLFTFLTRHVEIHTKSSFNDISFSLENLFVEVLNIIEGSNDWINANTIIFNYPAIDLLNKGTNQAIQVTTKADKRKIENTIEKYEENKMVFSKLIIIGFLKHSKYKKDNVEAVGIEYLTKLIAGSSLEVKEKVLKSIKKNIPLQLLNPLDDKDCFEVIFSVINRSAIRDNHYVEGSYDDMVLGLKEIKEIITTGNIKEKNIMAKPLSSYCEPLNSELSEIEYQISTIIQICNRSNNNGFVCLEYEDKMKIDKIKKEIIGKINELCKRLNIKKYIKY